MKTVTLNVLDDSKFHLLVNFLQEIRFIRIAPAKTLSKPFKTMKALPPSVLHPRKANTFTQFSREELHAR